LAGRLVPIRMIDLASSRIRPVRRSGVHATPGSPSTAVLRVSLIGR